jgi:hypothetical protein
MAGNLSYFAKKKLHPKIFEEQIEKMVDENNAADLPAAEIQKDKPKEKEKNSSRLRSLHILKNKFTKN